MKFILPPAAIYIYLMATTAVAEPFWGPGANPKSIGSVSVELHDEASGACWISLSSTKRHAEERLRLRGYDVASTKGNVTFGIGVQSIRDRGSCVGHVDIEIYRVICDTHLCGQFVIGFANYLLISSPNGNLDLDVTKAVEEMIAAM